MFMFTIIWAILANLPVGRSYVDPLNQEDHHTGCRDTHTSTSFGSDSLGGDQKQTLQSASRALGRQLDEQASLDMLNHLNGLVLPEDLFFIEELILSLFPVVKL
ncbi:unnamed protein product [Arctogadus glacialis]